MANRLQDDAASGCLCCSFARCFARAGFPLASQQQLFEMPGSAVYEVLSSDARALLSVKGGGSKLLLMYWMVQSKLLLTVWMAAQAERRAHNLLDKRDLTSHLMQTGGASCAAAEDRWQGRRSVAGKWDGQRSSHI